MSKKAALVWLVMAVAVFAGVVVPGLIGARSTPAVKGCIKNLRQLDAAKESWRLENHKTSNDAPGWLDLLPYLRDKPVCPQGGVYIVGTVGQPPRCSLGGMHALPR